MKRKIKLVSLIGALTVISMITFVDIYVESKKSAENTNSIEETYHKNSIPRLNELNRPYNKLSKEKIENAKHIKRIVKES